MGLFGSKNVQPAPVEAPKQEGTVIAEGVCFVGDFITEEKMTVKGRVQGEIKSTTEAVIANSGSHEGKILAHEVTIDGKADSEIICDDITRISPSGVLKGNVSTVYFEPEHGSTFDGKLNIKKAQEPKEELNEEA